MVYRAIWKSSAAVTDCASLPASATLWYGDEVGTVAIEAGGTSALEDGVACNPADQCYDAICDCPIDDFWANAGFTNWTAEGWTTLVPAIFMTTLPDGVACDQPCRNVISAELNATRGSGCTLNWLAYYALTCDTWDEENQCGTGCTFSLVAGPFIWTTGNACPDPLPDVSAWGIENPC